MSQNLDNDSVDASIPESPCVRNCCLDNDDICLGCYRHIKEIIDWNSLPSEGKRQVLDNCERRKNDRNKGFKPYKHPANTSGIK